MFSVFGHSQTTLETLQKENDSLQIVLAGTQYEVAQLKHELKQQLLILTDAETGHKKAEHRQFLLEKENETLRKLMRGYIYQIDSLYTLLNQLSKDLDECQSTQFPDTVYKFPEVEAQFIGGATGMMKYFTENIEYPSIEPEFPGSLKVWTKFVVDRNGKVRDVMIERGSIKELNAAALKVIEGMPDWIPAEHYGKRVASWVRLPIGFEL